MDATVGRVLWQAEADGVVLAFLKAHRPHQKHVPEIEGQVGGQKQAAMTVRRRDRRRKEVVSPGSGRQRDGLVVSALDGVAAVARVGGRVEDWTLHSDVNLLPLVWQLHRQVHCYLLLKAELLKPSGKQKCSTANWEKQLEMSSLECGLFKD